MSDEIQSELPFVEGDLRGLPWAAIIITSARAAALEESGEIEWTGDFYRQCDDPTPEIALNWLAVISERLEGLRLDPFDYRVLAHLVWRAGNRGTCWPSYEQIAAATGISRRRIAMALRTLVDRKLITFRRGHKGVANTYQIGEDLTADPLGPMNYLQTMASETPKTEAPATLAYLFGDPAESEPAHEQVSELFAHHLPAAHSKNLAVMLALGAFEKSRREARKKMTPTGIRTLCRKIAAWSAEEIVEAAESATAAGWLSLYKPSSKREGAPASAPTKDTNLNDWKQ
jgi:hypothetical protein